MLPLSKPLVPADPVENYLFLSLKLFQRQTNVRLIDIFFFSVTSDELRGNWPGAGVARGRTSPGSGYGKQLPDAFLSSLRVNVCKNIGHPTTTVRN